MGLFDKFDDYLLEYGPSVALGAGVGFLVGGPPGAAIGAGAAAASVYAGPRAARALPAGTPKEIRKAVEYGVYGLGGAYGGGGGLAARAAARAGLPIGATVGRAFMSRAFQREAAKFAAGSGLGAVAGGKAAQVAGAPEIIGEIGGSIIGPFSPSIAQRLIRGPTGRPVSPKTGISGQQVLGSSERAAQVARQQAASSRATISKLAAQIDDESVRAATGGYSREYLAARVRNQLPPGLREFMSPELRKARRRLTTLNKQVSNKAAQVEEARAVYDRLTSKLPVGGELSYSDTYKAFVWRTPDGTESLVPDAVGEAITSAKQRLVAAETGKTKFEKMLQTLLDSEIVPDSLDEQLDALRLKFLPPEAVVLDQTLLDPAEARQLLRVVREADAEQAARFTQRSTALENQATRLDALADYLEANPQVGAPAPGRLASASRDLADVLKHERLMAAAGAAGRRFIEIPSESAVTFDDYSAIVQFIAASEATPARAAARLRSMFGGGLRGSVWLEVPNSDGAFEPRHLLGFDVDRRVARVRSDFQAAEAADEVPLERLRLRFDRKQQQALSDEMTNAAQQYVGKPHPTTGQPLTAQQVRQMVRDLPALQPQNSERWWATRRDYEQATARAVNAGREAPPADHIIEEELAKAWEKFHANFTPAGNTIETSALTPEFQRTLERGFRNFQSRGVRAGSTPVERATHVEFQRFLRQSREAIEGSYMAVEDRELLRQIGALSPTDPRLPVLLMTEQSVSDVAKLTRPRPFGGAIGQAMERYGAGIVVQEAKTRGILQHYFGDLEASANYVGGTYRAMRVAAANQAAKMLGRSGSVGQGLRSAARAMPHPGRVIAAFVEDVHPLSKDVELARLLRQEFKPERLANVRLREQFASLDDGQRAVASEWLTSQFRTFVENPEAFPGLANQPEFQALRNAWRMNDDILTKEMQVMHATPQTQARRMSMLVDRKIREYLNLDVLNSPEATPLDVFDQVWQAVGGDPRKAAAALVHGADADMAHSVAGYQSIAVGQVVEKIKSLAKPGETIGPNDLIFRGGNWEIRSFNKFPRELHDSLKGLSEVMGGKHKWEGLQQLSQNIAMGNLAADLSVLGVQGFKYAAHSLLAGNPARAVRVLANGLTHITTDYGYYSWLRQNLDEIMYYSSRGLTGGLRGYIAGPELSQVPLEQLPLIRNVAKAAYGFSDLQFSRAVFYWKVQGVRENLEAIRTLKAVRGQVSDKFLADLIEASPTLRATAQDMGGTEAYLLADTQDHVDAVIRQVNRSLGGVNLQYEGVGATRRAVEQIMMIVPGFFRAQIGQWASVLTRPNSLEGHIALSMLAREYMFAGAVATGLGRLLGTEDKINWTDMSKATWLGVPMPDGSVISLLPTMSVPRLAARSVRTAIQAAQGENVSPTQALESFALGRLSPVVGAFYDNIRGEDYLGRKYTSNLDRWSATLSQVTLPIVMQSAIEDLKEEIRHGQATGDYNWLDVAASTGADLIGKGRVPAHPSQQLNTLARGAYGTDWSLLTDREKAELRQGNPAVAAAEAEYDFYTSRRADTEEALIDRAYKRYQENVDKVWQEPVAINGLVSTQEQDDVWVAQGIMTGDTWRRRYHVRQTAVSQWYDALRQELIEAGADPEDARAKRLERLRENRPEDRAVLIQLARAEYSAIEPPTERRTVATPAGEVTIEVVNWDEFFSKREAVLNQYPADIRDAARRSAVADQLPGIDIYRQASAKQREIEALGRYRGLTPEQGDKLDRMRAVITQVGDAIRGPAGLPSGSIPQSMLQRAALQEMHRAGIVVSNDDLRLATLAFAMSRNEQLADAMRNPAQTAAILNNPAVVIYYPYLRFRVPRAYWARLPAQVFQAELAEAELAAFAA